MFKRTTISLGALLALSSTLPMMVQAQDAQRVEITGSSIKRIDAEGSLPVQVITRDEIARTGATSTEQLLANISSLSSQGNVTGSTGAGTSTYGRSTVSLRGLEDSRTLVLVNGRRLAAFAGGGGSAVNVNAIPLAAIDRVEILTDGASAVYGSDAIAGVVNFILAKDVKGIEIAASTTQPTRKGGGDNKKVSLVGGFGDLSSQGFNVTASFSVEKDTALYGRERDFANTSTRLPYFSGSATGLGNIQGAWQVGAADPLTGVWVPGKGVLKYAAGGVSNSFGNPNAAAGTCSAIGMFQVATPTSKGAPYCQYDSAGAVGLVPERELKTLSLNAVVKLNDAAELFGDVLWSQSDVTQTYQASPARSSFFDSDGLFDTQKVDRALLVSPGSAAYTTAKNYLLSQNIAALTAVANSGLPFGVSSRVFDFGPRSDTSKATQTRVVGGVRGNTLGQDYEIAAYHNGSDIAGKVTTGYFSQVAFAKIINDPNSGWNPWSLTQSPELTAKLAAAKFSGATLSGTSTIDGIDAKLSGDLFKMAGGTAQYAFGAQSRQEHFYTNPSAALFTGDIAGLGGATAPIDRRREVNSVFSEINLPAAKGLEGNLAFRGDNYSDVGGSATGKASLRWQPTKAVLIRGSVGTGFRAPTLSDLWLPQTLGTSEAFNDKGQTGLQVTSLSGGNPKLKPETSKQQSIGFVFAPTSTFTAAFDLFDITVNGIISTPSAQEVVSQFRLGNPAYQNLVALDANGDVTQISTVNANNGKAKVQGVDVNLNYRDGFSFGKVAVNLSGTYMSKFDQSTAGTAVSHKVGTMVDADGNPVIGAQGGGVILRWKHVLSANWSLGGWGVTLTQNFYKGYEDGHDLNDNRHYVASQALYDAQVAYTGIKNLKLAVGAKNIFDKNPPLYIPASNQFQAGFDIGQYDPRARTVYLNASYKFF